MLSWQNGIHKIHSFDEIISGFACLSALFRCVF